jgi:hypothetical protein
MRSVAPASFEAPEVAHRPSSEGKLRASDFNVECARDLRYRGAKRLLLTLMFGGSETIDPPVLQISEKAQ